MPFGLGFGETILILAVILLFFGPKRLPEAAQSLGKGIREFKNAFSGIGDEVQASQTSTTLPPHSTFVGPGADPYAIPAESYPPVAAEAPAAEAVEPHPADRPSDVS